MNITTASTISWSTLVALEPRLLRLEERARRAARNESRRWKYACGNRVWSREIKPLMANLVGWGRRDNHPVLGTSAAFDVAYSRLCELMPPCGQCSCL